MLRQYTNELKNYNFLQKFTQGYFVDAKDQGRWKVGRVQQIRKIGHKTCVQIMFDGYSYKYNQNYDIPSYNKLAPFRKFTLPYTGISGQDPRRQQPVKSLEHYIKCMNKICSDMDNIKSEQINQFIRGQLFIFIDYWLTIPLKSESKYQYDDYMRLFFTYLQTFNKVLDKVIDFLKQVQKQGNLDQNYVYVYPKMSWLYSVIQFLFNCNSMISEKQQRINFHVYFGRHQSRDSIYSAFKQKVKSLKLYQKCQKLMNFKVLNGGRCLPWSIKKQALIFMKSLNHQQKVVLPKQTKQVIQFLQFLPYLTKKNVITMEEEQKYRNQLIFHLILYGNFQGKLIGLNQIKRLIMSMFSYKKQSSLFQLIKQKNLLGFFLDNNNFNSELFKRSMVIFQYCYKKQLFTKQHFPLVFKLHKDKHELELKNFYSSLAEFGSFLSQTDSLQYFQALTKELPFEQNFIDLIRNYTISTIQKNTYFKKIYMTKDEHGFGLIYFWQLINNQSKINKELITKIIESFATLLNNIYFSKQIQRFIVSSIKAIKDYKNPESFLKVIHESLKLCKGQKMNKAIQTAERQINVIEAAMNMLRQKDNNLSETGFENLFEFLQEVNYISRKGLSPGDIMFMWKMDKNKCRHHLLKFLRKYKIKPNEQKSHQRIISKSLQTSQIQFIIKNIFESDQLMQGYKNIDMEHYDTIDELILCYLHNKKIIEYNYKHTIRYRKNECFIEEDKIFLGMNFYLKLIQNNNQKYQQVMIKCIKRLCQIFLRPLRDQFPSKSYLDIKIKNWLKLSKIFDNLKNNKLKCYQIQITQIYGRMKSLNFLSPQPVQIRTKQANSNKIHTFVLPRFASLWRFRLQINQKFEYNNTNFQIQLVQQNTTTNLQRQQDLSVAFITTAKQKNGISVIVHPSKQQHPNFKAIDKFKQQQTDMIGQNLYKNLSSNNTQKSTTSLNILFNLPFLKTLQKSIQSLDFKQWNDIIDMKNMDKMQYQIKIIKKNKDMKWIQNFLAKGGIKHLSQVVLNNVGKNRYKSLNLLMPLFNQSVMFNEKFKNPVPFTQQFLKDILFYEKQKTDDYEEFLINCFVLIRNSPRVKITSLFQKQKITQILQYVLFTKKKTPISNHLIQICRVNNINSHLNKNLRPFLNLKYLQSKTNQCQQFFEILRVLIQKNQLSGSLQMLQQLLIQIRNSDIKQKSQNQLNQLILGYLLCLNEFIRNNNFQQILKQKKQSFFMHLLNQCLFHPQNIALRKFKSKQLRQLGFKILQILQSQIKKDNEIDKLLIPMMAKGSWRRQFDWAIQPVEFINKKFTGLKNLAATCYINSLLQQLFYIKNFSSHLMAVDADKIQDKQNIVRQIQNIFGFLKYSQNPSYTTLSLCHNFILDGQPIDPRIQTDVDEFFHALMDKLERNLSKINRKQIINQVFRGQFSNMIIGQQCPHASQRIQHFLSIRLQIKNKKTIYQAFDQFIKGQVLQGQNAYFCQKCDKKVKALKRVCLKDLPSVLIVTLKRFQFDYDTMQKFKLNTYCSFPQNINLLPYTKQGLQQDSEAKKEDYEYKLKGVVIHYGISQAGHYTSYVRTDQTSWNYFDDQRISEFQLSDLQNQCFGGIEENPFGDDQQKKKNAYLLIYEKVKISDELKQVPEEVLTQSKVYQLVQQDNVKNKLVNLLFEPNIQNYIFNLAEHNHKVFLIYYHTVFLRNGRKSDKYVEFYQKCFQLVSKKNIAEWYLKQIDQSFLMQFILYGEYETKYIVASLIIQAMKNCVDLQFMQQCVALLNNKMMMPLVKIFAAAPTAQIQYGKYLSSINLSQVIINIIKGKDIKQISVIKKAQSRKNVSQFGMAASNFIDRNIFNPKDLLQAIQNLKVGITLQEMKQFALSIKNKRTLKSLAMITARKYKDLDQFKKLLQSFLQKQLFTFDPKTGEQPYYGFLIQLVQEFCKINDKEQQQRVNILVKIYVQLMKQSLIGFKSQIMLFNGFFRMALTNPVFKNSASVILNDKQYKKVISAFKDWLKDLPNVIQNIRTQKWGWWRKPKKNYPGLTTQDVNNQVKPSLKQALSLLNSIIQKHQLQQVSQWLEANNTAYLEQKHGPQFVTITRRMGFLVQCKDENGNHRFRNEDQLIKKFI